VCDSGWRVEPRLHEHLEHTYVKLAKRREAPIMGKFDDSLRGYAFRVHERDSFKCRYYGADGANSFETWLTFSQDHLLPKGYRDRDNPTVIVTACNLCNTADNRYFDLAPKRALSFDGLTRRPCEGPPWHCLPTRGQTPPSSDSEAFCSPDCVGRASRLVLRFRQEWPGCGPHTGVACRTSASEIRTGHPIGTSWQRPELDSIDVDAPH
jgi:hypothetical protein